MDLATLRSTLPAGVARAVCTADELGARHRAVARVRHFSSGFEPVDALVGGGLAAGRFQACVGAPSSGRFTLVLAVLAEATRAQEATALIDLGDHLDPVAAERAGVVLERLLWVRPRTLEDALVAAEMILATGFALVVLDLGVAPVVTGGMGDAPWTRIARAAHGHGAAFLLSSPVSMGTRAAASVLGLEREQTQWWMGGEAGALLAGISSRIAVVKDRGAPPGRARALSLLCAERILPERSPRPDPPPRAVAYDDVA